MQLFTQQIYYVCPFRIGLAECLLEFPGSTDCGLRYPNQGKHPYSCLFMPHNSVFSLIICFLFCYFSFFFCGHSTYHPVCNKFPIKKMLQDFMSTLSFYADRRKVTLVLHQCHANRRLLTVQHRKKARRTFRQISRWRLRNDSA